MFKALNKDQVSKLDAIKRVTYDAQLWCHERKYTYASHSTSDGRVMITAKDRKGNRVLGAIVHDKKAMTEAIDRNRKTVAKTAAASNSSKTAASTS